MVVRNEERFTFGCGFRRGSREDVFADRQLGARRGVARGQDAFGRLEFVGHVEQQFARRGQRGRIVGERDAHALLRRGFQSVDDAPAEGIRFPERTESPASHSRLQGIFSVRHIVICSVPEGA